MRAIVDGVEILSDLGHFETEEKEDFRDYMLEKEIKMRFTPEMSKKDDSARLQAAIDAASRAGGGSVHVGARPPSHDSERDYWLLDRALLLHSDITLELDNCKIKLSDRCRDNFIRSANCGEGVSEVKLLRNIHIIGRGNAVLEGADRPRSTGDSGKGLTTGGEYKGPMKATSYGADANDPEQEQRGDWRNIGILLACVENFRLENLKIVDSHCWAVSLERCAHGDVRDLRFDSTGYKKIDGGRHWIKNQDGLDLRQGCHDITIDGLSGRTGDDMLALTAARSSAGREPGVLGSTMVSGTIAKGEADDVYNIIARNIRGSAGGNHVVRFLNNSGINMHTIIVDGVIGTASAKRQDRAVIVIGDTSYGGAAPVGHTRGFIINNVQGCARYLIEVRGTLSDSVLSNLIYSEKQEEAIMLTKGSARTENVKTYNTVRMPLPRQ